MILISLRDAEPSDREFFFHLRNEKQSVRFSYTKREVEWKEHRQWWFSTDDHLLVAVCDDWHKGDPPKPPFPKRDIGTVRLTPLDEHTCELHFAISPEW